MALRMQVAQQHHRRSFDQESVGVAFGATQEFTKELPSHPEEMR